MYLVLKELAPFTENAFVIVNSLLKDMGSPVDVYRGNAIRVLCRITDVSFMCLHAQLAHENTHSTCTAFPWKALVCSLADP